MGQLVRIMPSCSAEDFCILLASDKMNHFLEAVIARAPCCIEVKYVSKYMKRDEKVDGALYFFFSLCIYNASE